MGNVIMKFVYGLASYLESVGFDTTHFRRSEDGLFVICHDKYVEKLVSVNGNPNLKVYDSESEEFKNLIADQFTPKPEVIYEEVPLD